MGRLHYGQSNRPVPGGARLCGNCVAAAQAIRVTTPTALDTVFSNGFE